MFTDSRLRSAYSGQSSGLLCGDETKCFHINPYPPPHGQTLPSYGATALTSPSRSSPAVGGLAFCVPSALAAAPVLAWDALNREKWHALAGPGAHHHAFWIPFVIVAGVAEAHIRRDISPLLLLVGSTIAFPG